MKDDRSVDIQIARRIFGHRVLQQEDGALFEECGEGEAKPLPRYSLDMGAAWDIVKIFPMTMIPIEDGSWFALVGESTGWKDPGEFLRFLQAADFVKAGAAVAATAPQAICLAALKAVEKRDQILNGLDENAEQPH